MGNMGNGMPPTNPFAGMSFNKNQSQAFGSLQAPVDDLSGAKGNPAGGWIGLGAGLSSAIGEMMPTPYNQNIGMEKPNFFKEMLNAQYTGMGAAIGGPWGALVGGIIDTGKNIGSYVNKQAKWNQALQRWENTTEQEQRMQTMQPDYTGYARHGMKVPQYQNGGATPTDPPPTYDVNLPTLTVRPDNTPQQLMLQNMNLPMVQRMFMDNPPTMDNGDGSYSTHRMAWGGVEGGNVVFPTIDMKDGRLQPVEDSEVMNTMRNNGIFLPSSKYSDQFTDQFASGGYKQGANDLMPWLGGKPFPEYAQGGMVPVEIERNEAVVMPTGNGYQMMGVTPPDAPTHEQGGIKTQLPEGALVFPQQYVPQVQQAIQTGDNGMMAQLTQDMLAKSQQAAQQGKPYSSGGLFGNGGEVIAQKVKAYNKEADTDSKIAQSIFKEAMDAQGKGDISNDELDLVVSGLLSKIDPNETYAVNLREKHKDYYDYFHGDAAYKAPGTMPDVVRDDRQMLDIAYLQRQMGFNGGGSKQKAYSQSDVDNEAITALKKYELGQSTVDELFNATRNGLGSHDGSYNMAYKPVFEAINKANPKAEIPAKWHTLEGSGDKVTYKPVDMSKPATTTPPYVNAMTQGLGSQQQPDVATYQQNAPKTAQAVTGADRTATRMAAMKSGLYADDKGTPLTYWDDKSGKRMFNDYARTKYGMQGDVMAATMAPVFKQDLKAMGGAPSKEAPKTTPQQPAQKGTTPAYVQPNLDALRSAEEAHSKKTLEAYNNKSFGAEVEGSKTDMNVGAEVKGSKPAVYTGPSFDPDRDSIYLLPRDKSGGVYPQYQGPDAPPQEIQLVPRSNEGGKQPQYTGNVATPMYVPPRTEGGGIMQFGTGVKDMESESRTSNERPSYTTPIKEQQNSNTDEQQRNIDYMNDERDYKLATPKLPYKADLKLKGAPGLQNYLNWKLQELHEEQMKREREARNKNR